MKQALSLVALTLSTTLVVACGGSSSKTSTSTGSVSASTHCPSGNVGTPAAGGQTIRVAADPSGAPSYKPGALNAKSGSVTIAFSNQSTKCHDVALKTPAGKNFGHTQRVKRGTAYLTVNLPTGSYVYYSTVPGDEPAGMQGTLIVK